MAKDKDRTLNPAAAHLKSEKNKALKKSKAQQSAQRNEKLARRNPERLQRQIDELKETREAQGGQLRPRDQQALEQLERDVKAIRKARESTGTGAPEPQHERRRDGGDSGGRSRGGPPSSLGKRRREGYQDRDDFGYQSDETDPEVRDIPMPRDTPPPIPPRPRRQQRNGGKEEENGARSTPHALPAKPVPQTTYSSAPQMRDLQKEATTKFVPAAVAARLKQKQGMACGAGGGEDGGRLLEPEEVDALERGGYLAAKGAANEAAKEEAFMEMSKAAAVGAHAGTLEEEEAAFEREIQAVDEAEGADDADSVAEESNRRDAQREMLAEAGKRDAEKAAEAAADEEAHEFIAQEAAARSRPKPVEMEEVEDEDL